MVLNPSRRLLQVWSLVGLAAVAAPADPSRCASAALAFTTHDMSLELGAYGTLFREASVPECQPVVRVQLLRKLQLAVGEAPRFDAVLGRTVPTFGRWLSEELGRTTRLAMYR